MIIQWDMSSPLPLPANSVDMIFSDPPYVKDQIWTYEALAQEAARLLKPGKFIAVMCGGAQLNRIFRWFDDAGLGFYWLYQFQMRGNRTSAAWKNLNGSAVPISTRVKNILVYSKGPALCRAATVGLYVTHNSDKRYHAWGQSIDSHRYYIDCFSEPGDLVLDPMVGGGTTAEACELLGRRWIVGDIDPVSIATTKQRILDPALPLTDLPLFSFAAPNSP